MKKGAFLMALAIATGMVSCAQGPKANMKNEVDTLSYMMGVSNTQGLQEYALGRMESIQLIMLISYGASSKA